VPTISLDAPRDPQEKALADMLPVPPLAMELGERFAKAGFALHLVGGSVRDALLGRVPGDLDFATDARPDQIRQVAAGWATVWDAGEAFGTIGLARDGVRLEVTTYRAESYDRDSRKPDVTYGESLIEDLSRRDFTVNAMAVSVPGREFVDPHGGLRDLASGLLRTPGTPERSFDDDPLRILRAARFVATLGFSPVPEVVAAMSALAPRLVIVSQERVRDELSKLLLGADPVAGLELAVGTGVAEVVLPEVPRLKLAQDEHGRHKDVYAHTMIVLRQVMDHEPGGEPDLVLRWAALLHDVGKPDTRRFLAGGQVSFHHHEVRGAELARRRLVALRYPRQLVTEVELLVRMHLRFHGYGDADWTDSAVRRYVTDAGAQLDRLHTLVRSDCTTRNKAKARKLAASYDDLVARIADLSRREDLASIRADLDGHQVMRVLGLPAGPLVGQALAHLLERRMQDGPLGEERAVSELRAWAAERGWGDGGAPRAAPVISPRR
jgi:poly(A) polymerase